MKYLRFTFFVGLIGLMVPQVVADGPQQNKPKQVVNSYSQAFQAWKAGIENLQGIRDRIAVAKEDEVAPLRKQYAEALEDGKVSLRGFTDAAEKELTQGKKNKREAAAFLENRLEGLLNMDDFERALRIGQLLIAQGDRESKFLEATGVAAYMTNHAQMAEDYLKQAAQIEPLTPNSRELLESIPNLESVWEKEQQIREAEQMADDLPRVKLSTSQGDIVVELFENEAPQTVANFIHLVDEKFYDGLNFHRVIPHRVAQAGCPVGDGTGGPGYSIRCECLEDNSRRHFRGSLSMARMAEHHTGGSQFFFCLAPANDLDGKYTVFGRIIEGMDVLAKLQRREASTSTLLPADKILKAEVQRQRDHAYQPTPYVAD